MVVVAVVVVAASSSSPPRVSTKLTASSATITPVRVAAIRMRVGVGRGVDISQMRLAAGHPAGGSSHFSQPVCPGTQAARARWLPR